MILGGGPNRIGQGIEFDYCCVQAAFALRDAGYEVIMVNSNPETVSTDYDTSDHLFFEPLTVEDVLNVYDRMKPDGRDRAVRRADAAEPGQAARSGAGVPIIGTSVDSTSTVAENRKRFRRDRRRTRSLKPAGQRHVPPNCHSALHAHGSRKIGYPVLVRPSFVLGGRDDARSSTMNRGR